MTTGILNINKPQGLTSHDVINRIRRLIGVRKVGHTGTLNPLATGVLLVCVGQATRLIEYMQMGTKVYQATILFGKTTNTYDSEGKITAEHDPSHLTELSVCQALAKFVGTIEQVPPVFSAIKKDGVPLHKLARQGIHVEPKARMVHIDKIFLLNWHMPQATIEVTCQAGTYIRSIAHDMGQVLGVGGHLTDLIRTANGNWHVDTATSLDDVENAVNHNKLNSVLYPKEKGITHLPAMTLLFDEVRRVRMGQAITNRIEIETPIVAGYDENKKLVALLHTKLAGFLRPTKVFH